MPVRTRPIILMEGDRLPFGTPFVGDETNEDVSRLGIGIDTGNGVMFWGSSSARQLIQCLRGMMLLSAVDFVDEWIIYLCWCSAGRDTNPTGAAEATEQLIGLFGDTFVDQYDSVMTSQPDPSEVFELCWKADNRGVEYDHFEISRFKKSTVEPSPTLPPAA